MDTADRIGTAPPDRATELAAVEEAHPYWRTWAAVIPGLFYARRPRSTPPIVVRALTPAGLGPAIELAERERGLRD